LLDAALPPFPGFRPEAFQFLRDLKEHNDRAWFKPRKSTFDDELAWPLRCLVAQLGRDLPARGVPLTGDPDRAIFRIYRDTRFSKDKDPYKSHVGAYLTRSGDRKEDGGLYVQFGADDTFIGAGFWNPDPTLVRRWRDRLAAAPAEFMDVVSSLEGAGLTMRMQDPLKRLPRGYETLSDNPAAEYLKAKGIFATRKFDERAAGAPALSDTIVDTAVAVLPLLEWGWGIKDG
jgi:uncharacterized protein (TIGR02453 family)